MTTNSDIESGEIMTTSTLFAVPCGGDGGDNGYSKSTSVVLVDVESNGNDDPPPPQPPASTTTATGGIALPCATISVSYKATKAPKETLQAVYKAGEYKAGLPLHLLMIQSFMAGVYIAMAGQLYLSVGGGVIGAALFPTGLIAVVLTSAELFTGDSLVFCAAVLGQRVTVGKLARNWTVAWIMNFAGCLFWAGLLAYLSDALNDAGQVDLAIKVAEKKAHQAWVHIFLKGIGANFMVCVGVWQATCAEEVAGKILALWFPIAAFVMMGFDHAIANQFLIPVGMMYGADVSVGNLFWALLPATLGNAVGGGVLVGGVYWYVYEEMASSKQIVKRIRDSLYAGQKRLSSIAATTMHGSDDGDRPNNEKNQ
jgi:formate/nitrite transporter